MLVKSIYYFASLLSIVFYVGSVQFKEKKEILGSQILASICYLVTYIILKARSGMWIEIVELTKNILFFNYEKENKKIPMVFLLISIFLLFYISYVCYEGIFSLIPLVINIIAFVASYLKKATWMRISMLVCAVLWMTYNIYVGAFIIVFGNVLEILSAIISFFRFKEEN